MANDRLSRIAERSAKWRFAAEMLNAYRVVPRIILFTYYGFFMFAWYFVVEWFMEFDWNALPKDNEIIGPAVVAAVAGFPAIILGVLTKILKDLTTSYWNGTPKWGSSSVPQVNDRSRQEE